MPSRAAQRYHDDVTPTCMEAMSNSNPNGVWTSDLLGGRAHKYHAYHALTRAM